MQNLINRVLDFFTTKVVETRYIQIMGTNSDQMLVKLNEGVAQSETRLARVIDEIARLETERVRTELSIKAAKSAVDVLTSDHTSHSRRMAGYAERIAKGLPLTDRPLPIANPRPMTAAEIPQDAINAQ